MFTEFTVLSVSETPTRKNTVNVAARIDRDVYDALKRYETRVGVPLSEQIRRALRAWAVSLGELTDTNEAREGVTRAKK